MATMITVAGTEAEPVVGFAIDGEELYLCRHTVAELAKYLGWDEDCLYHEDEREVVLERIAEAVTCLIDHGDYIDRDAEGEVRSNYRTDLPESVRRQYAAWLEQIEEEVALDTECDVCGERLASHADGPNPAYYHHGTPLCQVHHDAEHESGEADHES